MCLDGALFGAQHVSKFVWTIGFAENEYRTHTANLSLACQYYLNHANNFYETKGTS